MNGKVFCGLYPSLNLVELFAPKEGVEGAGSRAPRFPQSPSNPKVGAPGGREQIPGDLLTRGVLWLWTGLFCWRPRLHPPGRSESPRRAKWLEVDWGRFWAGASLPSQQLGL